MGFRRHPQVLCRARRKRFAIQFTFSIHFQYWLPVGARFQSAESGGASWGTFGRRRTGIYESTYADLNAFYFGNVSPPSRSAFRALSR